MLDETDGMGFMAVGASVAKLVGALCRDKTLPLAAILAGEPLSPAVFYNRSGAGVIIEA